MVVTSLFSTPKTSFATHFLSVATYNIMESSSSLISFFRPIFIFSSSPSLSSPSKAEFCTQFKCCFRYWRTLSILSTAMSYTTMTYTASPPSLEAFVRFLANQVLDQPVAFQSYKALVGHSAAKSLVHDCGFEFFVVRLDEEFSSVFL